MKTGCGAEITSPGLIKYPFISNEDIDTVTKYQYLNCTWIIRAPLDQIVQIAYVLICSLLLMHSLSI